MNVLLCLLTLTGISQSSAAPIRMELAGPRSADQDSEFLPPALKEKIEKLKAIVDRNEQKIQQLEHAYGIGPKGQGATARPSAD